MRVALVNDFYAPASVGGAEAMVRELAVGCRKRGHDVLIITARTAGAPARDMVDGIPVVRIGGFPPHRRAVRLGSGSAPSALAPATRSDFLRAVEWFCPDVVHFHNVWLLGPDIIDTVSSRKGLTLHDYWPICPRRSLMRVGWRSCTGPDPVECRLCRLRAAAGWRSLNLLTLERERQRCLNALRTCDFLTAPSQYMACRVGAAGRPMPTVVYNALRPGTSAPRRGGSSTYALFASRPTREKGYHVALQAFLLPELEGCELTIAGDVPAPKMTNVRVAGFQPPDRLQDLIAGAGCVVVPSIWPDNCPVIVLEALRAGVPVVASRIGGIPELVDEGVTGLLVEPGSPAALAEGIRQCMRDEGLRARARREGPQAISERFSLSGMVARFEGLYGRDQ